MDNLDQIMYHQLMAGDPRDIADQFKEQLTPDHALYFEKIQEASRLVEEVLPALRAALAMKAKSN